MTDIRDLTDEDDVAFAHRLIRDPGVAAVPGSSFFSRPELGRTKLRFAFPKQLATLEPPPPDRLARARGRGLARDGVRHDRPHDLLDDAPGVRPVVAQQRVRVDHPLRDRPARSGVYRTG